MMVKPVWTLDQIVTNLDRSNIAWLGQPITYAFLNARPSHDSGHDYAGFAAFNAAQRTAAKLALDLWSDVTNVTFVAGADTSNSTNKITFANSTTMPSYVWGWTSYDYGSQSAGGKESIDDAEVWVNSALGISSYANGTYNFIALMHEIGHTLGLSHPGDYNANGGSITYANDAEYQQDSRQYTIMSYFNASNTGANHGSQYASTPLLHDVAAIQAIYGANMATRADDTVYGFHSTAGRAAYDFTLTAQPIVAIWDGGGTDTIDLSGYSMPCTLDLNAGAFSDVGGLTDNLTICFGVTIENAVGGSGADHIIGNAVANTINPGGGDDNVVAGDGDDTIAVSGALMTNADVFYGGNGADTLQFIGTNSTLLSGVHEVETIRVADGSSYVYANNVFEVTLLLGGALADTIDAGTSAATVDGGGGDDVLRGITLLPGSGNDTLHLTGTNGVIRFDMAELTGADTVDLSESTNGWGTIRFLTSGTLTEGQLAGAMGVRTFEFAVGDDTFVSPDWMSGQTFYGGGGNDHFDISAMSIGGGDGYGDATVSGGDGDDTIIGSATGEFLSGDDGNDVIHFESGGYDVVRGGNGNDTLYGGTTSVYQDIDGGSGIDTLVLADNFNGVFIAATHVEIVKLTAGFDYTLSTYDGWLIDGSALGVDDVLTLNANYPFVEAQNVVGGLAGDTVYGGSLGDSIDGGGGNDTIHGNDGDDVIICGGGNDTADAGAGTDTVYGWGGRDTIQFAGDFTAADHVDGGTANDTLDLTGDYSAGLVTVAGTIVSIERIVLGAGFSYDLTLDDANVARKLTVDGSALAADQWLHFHGGTESNGRFSIYGGAADDTLEGSSHRDTIKAGAGNDTITGGGGADLLTGGADDDTYVYLAALDSGADGYDKISHFDGAADVFDLWFSIAAIDATFAVRRPGDVAPALDETHLAANDAVIVTLKSGAAFLAVDANGTAGYQAGEDLLIELTAPSHLDQLTLASFI